jgi:hypothetical protein
MSDAIELKTCHRCGLAPDSYIQPACCDWSREHPHVIACRDCGTEVNATTPEDAAHAWNTRPVEDALHARIAELERTLTSVHSVDIITIRRLCAQMKNDIARMLARKSSGFSLAASASIVDILDNAINAAPLMQRTREAAADVADQLYPGCNASRLAWNAGVKWAMEQMQGHGEGLQGGRAAPHETIVRDISFDGKGGT